MIWVTMSLNSGLVWLLFVSSVLNSNFTECCLIYWKWENTESDLLLVHIWTKASFDADAIYFVTQVCCSWPYCRCDCRSFPFRAQNLWRRVNESCNHSVIIYLDLLRFNCSEHHPETKYVFFKIFFKTGQLIYLKYLKYVEPKLENLEISPCMFSI